MVSVEEKIGHELTGMASDSEALASTTETEESCLQIFTTSLDTGSLSHYGPGPNPAHPDMTQ